MALYLAGRDPDSRDQESQSAACGISYGRLAGPVGVHSPRLVVGEVDDATAVGLHQGISGYFLYSLGSVELSHQIITASRGWSHELARTLGSNPTALLFWVTAAQHGLRRGSRDLI